MQIYIWKYPVRQQSCDTSVLFAQHFQISNEWLSMTLIINLIYLELTLSLKWRVLGLLHTHLKSSGHNEEQKIKGPKLNLPVCDKHLPRWCSAGLHAAATCQTLATS